MNELDPVEKVSLLRLGEHAVPLQKKRAQPSQEIVVVLMHLLRNEHNVDVTLLAFQFVPATLQ